MMLSDLDIGMNDWVVPRIQWDDSYRPDRGRVLSEEDLKDLPKFYRYANGDENHVAARTVPGVHPNGAYVTRGSGHNKFGEYTETPSEYQEVIDRLAAKHKAAANFVPAPIVASSGAPCGVITIGGCDAAVRETVDLLRERGIVLDYMRIRGFPFAESVERFILDHELCFVVEQNRDAQLHSLLVLETGIRKDRLRPVLVYGGFPLSARKVIEGILTHSEIDERTGRLMPVVRDLEETACPR